jgi:hypothetical protein
MAMVIERNVEEVSDDRLHLRVVGPVDRDPADCRPMRDVDLLRPIGQDLGNLLDPGAAGVGPAGIFDLARQHLGVTRCDPVLDPLVEVQGRGAVVAVQRPFDRRPQHARTGCPDPRLGLLRVGRQAIHRGMAARKIRRGVEMLLQRRAIVPDQAGPLSDQLDAIVQHAALPFLLLLAEVPVDIVLVELDPPRKPLLQRLPHQVGPDSGKGLLLELGQQPGDGGQAIDRVAPPLAEVGVRLAVQRLMARRHEAVQRVVDARVDLDLGLRIGRRGRPMVIRRQLPLGVHEVTHGQRCTINVQYCQMKQFTNSSTCESPTAAGGPARISAFPAFSAFDFGSMTGPFVQFPQLAQFPQARGAVSDNPIIRKSVRRARRSIGLSGAACRKCGNSTLPAGEPLAHYFHYFNGRRSGEPNIWQRRRTPSCRGYRSRARSGVPTGRPAALPIN